MDQRLRKPAEGKAELSAESSVETALPEQVVLVLQGGGALGAYQVGVYQALHEAGIEPNWVIGTSIGAINGAIIAGNPAAERMGKLDRFWSIVRNQHFGEFGTLGPPWPTRFRISARSRAGSIASLCRIRRRCGAYTSRLASSAPRSIRPSPSLKR